MCETFVKNCGVYGSCINSTCICEVGWNNSPDFSFDQLRTNQHACFTNVTILNIMYGLVLIINIVALLFYLSKATKFSRFKRLIPFQGACICFSGFSIAHFTADGPDSVITQGVAKTLFFAFSLSFSMWSYHAFVEKYLAVQYKNLAIKDKKFSSRLQKQRLMLNSLSILGGIMGLIFILTLAFESQETKEVLFKTGLTLGFIQTFLFGGSFMFLVEELIYDVKIACRANDGGPSEGLFFKVKKNLRQTEIQSVFVYSTDAVLFILPILSPIALLMILVSMIGALLNGIVASKAKKRSTPVLTSTFKLTKGYNKTSRFTLTKIKSFGSSKDSFLAKKPPTSI
eukprot:snap_masked-scaffold_25-processed-gene-4.30-mRNA-1 protein AED:1.00 eAED:1.00 QI:0/0/0/0/1/1/2/0/341